MRSNKCELLSCNNIADPNYGSGRFCSEPCARKFSGLARTEETRLKLSLAMKKYYKTHPDKKPGGGKIHAQSEETRRKISESRKRWFANNPRPKNPIKNTGKDVNNKKHKERKAFGIKYLGGECKHCGTTENLEFDHIDPTTKSFTITSRSTMLWDRWFTELKKCQLLCHDCHVKKTTADIIAKRKHGTWGMYKLGCKCVLCREFVNAYSKQYKRNKRTSSNSRKMDSRSINRGAIPLVRTTII